MSRLAMDLALSPQEHLCPLEALLTIYGPILECLVSHLPTPTKLALAQTSRALRQLLHGYAPFFAHLDFRLAVFESANFDSYPLGTVYNLDRLLQSLPVDGRMVSLTLDWTAVSGSFLFGRLLDRCQHTLEHVSVRGCRKVSIKHHIVPHFVYQAEIRPLGGRDAGLPRPALRSLYVYKARGVRRKPFLIDRKPADGDEPSRYLTTLAATLGIWIDLGLCPTPKLRCPRRREILRRGKENFCVPFDKRWRVPADDAGALLMSDAEHRRRRAREQAHGDGLRCWHCDAAIPNRCEACVHQMTCSACCRPLCHNCAHVSRSAVAAGAPLTFGLAPTPALAIAIAPAIAVANAGAGAGANANANTNAAGAGADTTAAADTTTAADLAAATATAATAAAAAAATAAAAAIAAPWAVSVANPPPPPPVPDHDDAFEAELSAIRSKLLTPCCRTAPASHADNLCAPCLAQTCRASCSLCAKPLCIKHELERCRRCEGPCGRAFCFSSAENREVGCGEPDSGRAGIRECLSCGTEICGMCRDSFLDRQPSGPAIPADPAMVSSGSRSGSGTIEDDDDDDGSESTVSVDTVPPSPSSPSPRPPPLRRTACDCRSCTENYYCPACWPGKPIPCEPRPLSIVERRQIMGGAVTLLLVCFENPTEQPRWFTPVALRELHPEACDPLVAEFSARQRLAAVLHVSPSSGPSAAASASVSASPASSLSSSPSSSSSTAWPDMLEPAGIKVGHDEWILERVLAMKPGTESGGAAAAAAATATAAAAAGPAGGATAAGAAGGAAAAAGPAGGPSTGWPATSASAAAVGGGWRPPSAVQPGSARAGAHQQQQHAAEGGSVLCKWLGRSMAEVTWELNRCFGADTHPRERALVDEFIVRCLRAEAVPAGEGAGPRPGAQLAVQVEDGPDEDEEEGGSVLI